MLDVKKLQAIRDKILGVVENRAAYGDLNSVVYLQQILDAVKGTDPLNIRGNLAEHIYLQKILNAKRGVADGQFGSLPNSIYLQQLINAYNSVADGQYGSLSESSYLDALIAVATSGSGPSSILTGLIAYWKLNEASDGSLPVQRNDSAGVNHLSDALQCLSGTGILGNCLVVAPSKQISIADNAALSMGVGVAFEIWGWAKITTGLAAFQEVYLVNKNGASSEYNILFFKPDANTYIQAFLRKADNSGTITVRATTYGNVATGSWLFFDIYHNPTTDLSGIAINNGTFDTQANTFDVRDSNNALTLGGASAGAGRALLDEVGIVKGRVLTATERTALYNGGIGKTYPF